MKLILKKYENKFLSSHFKKQTMEAILRRSGQSSGGKENYC